MYNQLLNDEWKNKLKAYCKDKRVLIVGNAVSLFANEYGEMIDSYDVVVRLGKGFPYPEHKKYLGSKTDVWMTGQLRVAMYKLWRKVPFQILNLTQIGMYKNDQLGLTISKKMLGGQYQVYRDFFLVGSIEKHLEIIRRIYGDEPESRVSAGTVAIEYFMHEIGGYKELALVGFDFFQNNVTYTFDGKTHEVASWHLPLPRYETRAQAPHAGDFEKNHILKLVADGKIVLHPMKPIDDGGPMALKLIEQYRHEETRSKPK